MAKTERIITGHRAYAEAFKVTDRTARTHSQIKGFPGYGKPKSVYAKWRLENFDQARQRDGESRNTEHKKTEDDDPGAAFALQRKRLDLQIQSDEAALLAMKRRREEGFYIDREYHVRAMLGAIKLFRQHMENMCEAVPANFPEETAIKMRRLMRSEYDMICENLAKLPGAPLEDGREEVSPLKHKARSKAQARRHAHHDV